MNWNVIVLVQRCCDPSDVMTGWAHEERQTLPAGSEAEATRVFRLGVEGSPAGMVRMMRALRAEVEKAAREQKLTVTASTEDPPGKRTCGFRFDYRSGHARGSLHATLERGKRFDRDETSQGKVEPWGGWSALLTVSQQEAPE